MNTKNNITHISDFTNNALQITPAQLLQRAAVELEQMAGNPDGPQCTKMLLIMLDDRGNNYNTKVRNSGLSCSQEVALLEVVKERVIGCLNGRE